LTRLAVSGVIAPTADAVFESGPAGCLEGAGELVGSEAAVGGVVAVDVSADSSGRAVAGRAVSIDRQAAHRTTMMRVMTDGMGKAFLVFSNTIPPQSATLSHWGIPQT
jgi:hypothetical protein